MITKQLDKGIKLHLLPDKKFKNFRVGVFFSTPLSSETASKNAIIAKLIKSGTTLLPDKRSINMRLEEMYGASLNTGVEKNGESHVISVSLDVISDEYIADKNITKEAFEFLNDVIFSSTFSSFEREKTALIDEIRALVNDKRKYALIRCIEEICKGESFAISRLGSEKDVADTDIESVKGYYIDILKSAPIDIFVIGSFDEENILNECTKLAQSFGGREAIYPVSEKHPMQTGVKYITDKENITQGKLVMGFKGDFGEGENYPLKVFNALFGGGTSSKLFNNVREKLSLCYYASSVPYSKKDIIFAQAGIEFENYEKTKDEIIKQLDEIKNGDITREEFDGAVLGLINDLRSVKDSLYMLMAYYGMRIGADKICEIDECVNNIKSVTPEQVVLVAQKINLDTVYFMTGNGAEN